MSDVYPKGLKESDLICFDDYTLPFHIGDNDGPDKKIKCKICGSNAFNVATSSYRTSIRCVNCLWELCVHDD